MSNNREALRATATSEKSRTNPESLYGADYYAGGYATGTGDEYGRHEPWLSFFNRVAENIVKNHKPKRVADIGCAFGLLVEALCDRGVDAYGFDLSPYAISNARNDMKDRLKVHSILEPIPLVDGCKYDLVICIEVLEHLPPEQAQAAIVNLCSAGDRIIFSSTPDDFDEPTHFNVLPTEEWLALFAKNYFFPAKKPQARYIAPHTFVVEKHVRRRGFIDQMFGRNPKVDL